MSARRILFDENLLLDLLLSRSAPSGRHMLLWELLTSDQVEGCLSDTSLAQIWLYLSRLRAPSSALEVVQHLSKVFTCLPSAPQLASEATGPGTSWGAALSLATALHHDLDGIVTNRPIDYQQGRLLEDMPILTPGQLLADCLQIALEDCRQSLTAQSALPSAPPPPFSLPTPAVALRLEHILVCSGHSPPSANIAVQAPCGETFWATASGVGAVDAAFNAIDMAVRRFFPLGEVEMLHYRTTATAADSEVAAVVLLQYDGALFPGRGFHTDILMASAQAYLDALGYLYYCDRN